MATSKTSKITVRPIIQNGTVIEFTRRTVIGVAEYDEFGENDIMSLFFKAVEKDSRDHMDHDHVSIDHYEMTDNLGTTKLTVQHTPHGLS